MINSSSEIKVGDIVLVMPSFRGNSALINKIALITEITKHVIYLTFLQKVDEGHRDRQLYRDYERDMIIL